MKRVIFLFNHDAAHQVAHLAGIAAATARLHPVLDCVVAYATPALRSRIEALISEQDAALFTWRELSLPLWAQAFSALFDNLFPASRLLRLRVFTKMFAEADMVVSTERTCLSVKTRLTEAQTPIFVRVPHGSGDRSVTFHPDHRKFDLSLVAGQKLADQLIKNGVSGDRIQIVGYSKFEQFELAARPKFFSNDRPTFVYNPHFDPHLSSWYDAGPDLLRWFASAQGQQFNLIFAPHVMLFRKAFHISPEYKVSRRRPSIPDEAKAADNILIDTDGPRLFDMSYMLGAEAYIGDASSQLYEFLVRPRPVYLLDPNSALQDEGADALPFLATGPAFTDVGDLLLRLSDWKAIGTAYRKTQEQLFAYTFDTAQKPATERAADAISAALSDIELSDYD